MVMAIPAEELLSAFQMFIRAVENDPHAVSVRPDARGALLSALKHFVDACIDEKLTNENRP